MPMDTYKFDLHLEDLSFTCGIKTDKKPEDASEAMRLFFTYMFICLKSIGVTMAEENVNEALNRMMRGDDTYEGMEG